MSNFKDLISVTIKHLLNENDTGKVSLNLSETSNLKLDIFLVNNKISFYLLINNSEYLLFSKSILDCIEKDIALYYDLRKSVIDKVNEYRNNLSSFLSEFDK